MLNDGDAVHRSSFIISLVRLRRGRGTSEVRYRCSVPGLAGFAASRLHGVRSLIKIADCRFAIAELEPVLASQSVIGNRKSKIT